MVYHPDLDSSCESVKPVSACPKIELRPYRHHAHRHPRPRPLGKFENEDEDDDGHEARINFLDSLLSKNTKSPAFFVSEPTERALI
jgi:hypothetical protein